MLKQCCKCGEKKDRSLFHKNKGNKDGLNYECKACRCSPEIRERNNARARAREAAKRGRSVKPRKHKKPKLKAVEQKKIEAKDGVQGSYKEPLPKMLNGKPRILKKTTGTTFTSFSRSIKEEPKEAKALEWIMERLNGRRK
jgi:hypothetical protein